LIARSSSPSSASSLCVVDGFPTIELIKSVSELDRA
jgi:hypothetical protein